MIINQIQIEQKEGRENMSKRIDNIVNELTNYIEVVNRLEEKVNEMA